VSGKFFFIFISIIREKAFYIKIDFPPAFLTNINYYLGYNQLLSKCIIFS